MQKKVQENPEATLTSEYANLLKVLRNQGNSIDQGLQKRRNSRNKGKELKFDKLALSDLEKEIVYKHERKPISLNSFQSPQSIGSRTNNLITRSSMTSDIESSLYGREKIHYENYEDVNKNTNNPNQKGYHFKESQNEKFLLRLKEVENSKVFNKDTEMKINLPLIIAQDSINKNLVYSDSLTGSSANSPLFPKNVDQRGIDKIVINSYPTKSMTDVSQSLSNSQLSRRNSRQIKHLKMVSFPLDPEVNYGNAHIHGFQQ